jgi:mono/diheme cytochrome c family protein
MRRHLPVLLGISCIAALSWAVVGCSKSRPGEELREDTQGKAGSALSLGGDAQRGLEVFKSSCASCHGDQGQGGIANPGSEDGTVPALIPIDPEFVSSDRAAFARNIDKIIEHGSKPEGKNPELAMPAYGDEKKLTPQQIADVIAYIIVKNGK